MTSLLTVTSLSSPLVLDSELLADVTDSISVESRTSLGGSCGAKMRGLGIRFAFDKNGKELNGLALETGLSNSPRR